MQRVQELDALRSLGRRVEHRLRLVLEQLQPGGDVARVSAPAPVVSGALRFHPRIPVEPQPGIEFGAKLLRIGERQCDQGGGDVPRYTLEYQADGLGLVGRAVGRSKGVYGIVGQGAGGSHGSPPVLSGCVRAAGRLYV